MEERRQRKTEEWREGKMQGRIGEGGRDGERKMELTGRWVCET